MAGVLEARVVLVTGASSGIGAAIARSAARAGATVIAAARRVDRLARLAAEHTAVTPLALDVADPAAPARAADAIAARHGRLDALINAAGIMRAGFVGVDDPADWVPAFETNFVGLVLLTRACLPLLSASGRGHVVNVSSTASRRPNPGSGAYAGSKAAVNAFSNALRRELAPVGIRVTVALPGLVESELFTHFRDEGTRERYRKRFGAMTPLQPDDVASAIVHALALPANVSLSELVIEPAKHPQ
jgi:NADP-dependent 3-hydroxy acid dehydrogenase YdfG